MAALGAGDEPSVTGSHDTTGGTAELRSFMTLLGSVSNNYLADAVAELQANQLIAYGQLKQIAQTPADISPEAAAVDTHLDPP